MESKNDGNVNPTRILNQEDDSNRISNLDDDRQRSRRDRDYEKDYRYRDDRDYDNRSGGSRRDDRYYDGGGGYRGSNDNYRGGNNYRDRSRDRYDDRRRRNRSRSPQGKSSEPIIEKTKEQKEIDDLTKDQRTVFVSSLTSRANENNLRSFFEQIGKVNNITMLRDKNTGRHKGFAYVEMTNLDDIPNCLLFNNVVPDFQKYLIMVKASEAEKNFLGKNNNIITADGGISNPADGTSVNPETDPRIYLGNLHPTINEAALRLVLEQFGAVDDLRLHRDELGNSKGFAFARFVNYIHAKIAMNSLAGMVLAERPLKVGPVIEGSTLNIRQNSIPSNLSNYSSNTSLASNIVTNDINNAATDNWKLDLDTNGHAGMRFSANDRVMLMAKLAEKSGIHVPLPPPPVQMMLNTNVNIPQNNNQPVGGTLSTCFMLNNMFNLEEETEEGWEDDIKEDVCEEVSKFGTIIKCHVETKKAGGLVYLKFATENSAKQAANLLNNRFFAQRTIHAIFIDPNQFEALTK